MPSAINPQYPVYGTPTTQSVRDNFAAAKGEIETLQAQTLIAPVIIRHTTSYTASTADPKNVAHRFDTTSAPLNLNIPTTLGTPQETLIYVHRDGAANVVVVMDAGVTVNGAQTYTLDRDKLTIALYKVGPTKWYALPINDSGQVVVQASPGAILTVDQSGRIVGSAATVTPEGSVKSGSPNSLLLEDAHSISSGVQNVFTLNKATRKAFHPVWVEVADAGDALATARVYTDRALSTFEVGTHGTDIYTNPDFVLTATANRRLWTFSVHAANTVANVELEIFLGSVRMWAYKVGDAVADQMLTIDFTQLTAPMDFVLGEQYRFKISSRNGDVQCYGDAAQGRPHIVMQQRTWEDKPVLHDDDRLVSMVAHTDKTATLTFSGGEQIVFNAQPWFGVVPPVNHEVYVGWYDADVAPTAAQIKAGSVSLDSDIYTDTHQLDAADAGGASTARAFIAWPVIAGDARYISLGTFQETWNKARAEIDGDQYHVFWSDSRLTPADINIQLIK